MSDTLSTYIDAFEAFESKLNGETSTPIHQLRRRAITAFAADGFPTPRDEAWKSTNLPPLIASCKTAPGPTSPLSSDVRSSIELGVDGWTIVFVNGRFDAGSSRISDTPDGLVVSSIADAIEDGDEALHNHVSTIAGFEDQAFTALNTAFLTDGAYIRATNGTIVKRPVHVVYLSDSEDATTYPRSLFIAEENSQLTIVETFYGLNNGAYTTNHVAEIIVENNATLDHYKVGLESDRAVHVSNMKAHQSRTSNFTSHSISIGGAFVRNDVSTALDGDACESTVNGLYVLNGSQHCDNYTLLEHRQPNCPSHELYKGILDGNSRAVFRGKIHVHQIAQKTDAYQQNKNVLLSEDARVNTKPQLEIYADDVKCSHGATIGQIDEDALFYLQTRGISRETAQRTLLEAFAGDILSRIKIDGLREALTDRVLHKISLGIQS